MKIKLVATLIFVIVLLPSLLSASRLNPVLGGETADAYLFITPSMCISNEVGEVFEVAINISTVKNLRSLEFTVTYNSSLLNVTQVVQGQFFPSPPASYFRFEKNESLGFVKVNMSLANSETPRSGNGTLVYMSFEVVQGPESCACSPLNFGETLLLSSELTPIAHDSVGAIYFWKSLQPDPPVEGRSLDLYTQRGGVGPDEPGGEFMVGEEVQLTSLVTYNAEPVQQKLVAFEVRNPSNESVVFRTAITDQSGMAKISFRIPGVVSNNGTWVAISIVEIAEEIVWDTISFQVYLIIGGHSFLFEGYETEKPLSLYLVLVAFMTAVFTMIKNKMHRRPKRLGYIYVVFASLLIILMLVFNLLGVSKGAEMLITDFYSCDASGNPQYYFPKKTTAYFNISVINLSQDPKNISIHLTVYDELDVPIGSDHLNTSISPGISTHYIMDIFIPKWAYVGVATAYASLSVEEVPIDGKSTELYIGPEDLIPPVIHIMSPENTTYETEPFSLTFTIDERTVWVGYSLNGLENVTINGNTTLAGLDNGSYRIVVYANDTSGNVGSSQKVYFTVSIVHDVAIIDLECSQAEVYIGQVVNITVLVQNEGTMPETFGVITYANNTIIETLPVTNLTRNSQEILLFVWNTESFAKGNYVIGAYINPVSREEDITDNRYTNGIVNVMLPPDIAIINITASKTLVGQGYRLSINVTVVNQGDHAENFNVAVYANDIMINSQNVTLESGNSSVLTLAWNTSDFAMGSYDISACVAPLKYEKDIIDNTFSDMSVFVTIAGDVTSAIPGVPDMIVNMRDVGVILTKFMADSSSPNWNPNYDINDDGIVNMRDIGIACNNFMKT